MTHIQYPGILRTCAGTLSSVYTFLILFHRAGRPESGMRSRTMTVDM